MFIENEAYFILLIQQSMGVFSAYIFLIKSEIEAFSDKLTTNLFNKYNDQLKYSLLKLHIFNFTGTKSNWSYNNAELQTVLGF